ncbi:hypothetical protein Tco_0440194, partial [Tanacetum coccineum]
AKKQKVDKDKETSELQSLVEGVSDDEEEVAIDDVPLATNPLTRRKEKLLSNNKS